jgi:hypothetical protein
MFFISVAQYVTAWIFYYRKINDMKESKKQQSGKTFQQIKKELKKKDKDTAFNKKQYKEMGSSVLYSEIEIEKPSVCDVSFFNKIDCFAEFCFSHV